MARIQPSEVHSRLRSQGGQASDNVQRFEYDVRRAIAVRRLQRVTDVAIAGKRQTLVREGRPTELSTQALELAALTRPRPNAVMQGEPGHLADAIIEQPLGCGQRLRREHLRRCGR